MSSQSKISWGSMPCFFCICHDPPADQPLTDDGENLLCLRYIDDLDITLCRDNPSAVISQSHLSQSSDLPVLYNEENNTPGLLSSLGIVHAKLVYPPSNTNQKHNLLLLYSLIIHVLYVYLVPVHGVFNK